MMYNSNNAYMATEGNLISYEEEKRRIRKIRKQDKLFEKKLEAYKNKMKLQLLGLLLVIDACAIAALVAVVALFYYVWFNYTNADVVYLIGWYLILNWVPNLIIGAIWDKIHSLFKQYALRDIKEYCAEVRREYYSREVDL